MGRGVKIGQLVTYFMDGSCGKNGMARLKEIW